MGGYCGDSLAALHRTGPVRSQPLHEQKTLVTRLRIWGKEGAPRLCRDPPPPTEHPLWAILLYGEKTDKENSQKGIGSRNAPEASQRLIRDVPGTPGTFGPIYVENHIRGAECPRDRRDIWRNRSDMSMGETGLIGFFFPHSSAPWDDGYGFFVCVCEL